MKYLKSIFLKRLDVNFPQTGKLSGQARILVILLVLALSMMALTFDSQIMIRRAGDNGRLETWQKADFLIKSYQATKDGLDLDKARIEINNLLALDSDKVYALRILAKLEKLGRAQTDMEIERTLAVVASRGDYLEAWRRLAILAKRVGKGELVQEAERKTQEFESKVE